MTLNAIAKRWVERLRSGTVKQCRGKLGSDDGKRCCLGVLCDIAVEDEVIPPPTISEGGLCFFAGREDVLPPVVMNWAALETKNGRVGNKSWLSEFNDKGKTFAEIADIIESEPRGLFASPSHIPGEGETNDG